VPPTAGSSTARYRPTQLGRVLAGPPVLAVTGTDQPRFYYDLASPESYFAAERALHAVGEVPEWIPVSIGEPAFRCAAEIDAYREDAERRAAALGLMTLRWPEPFPADVEWATLAATYAKWIGRGVAFSLAALRQAFAAAACEMHPAAVVKGVELESTRRELARANERAREDGVTEVPAIWVDGRLLAGERAIPA
jgi:2-hydroxychromene-2-carboxylate isomerase